MTAETVRIGVIGAGDISHYHLGGLQAAGGADVRVICGRRADRLAPVAEKYEIPDIETDYRAVLARDDVDAVMIAHAREPRTRRSPWRRRRPESPCWCRKPVADGVGCL